VGFADFLELREHFKVGLGNRAALDSFAAAHVPEPVSVGLVVLGVLVLCGGRGRRGRRSKKIKECNRAVGVGASGMI
jgi:hypothetical protein